MVNMEYNLRPLVFQVLRKLVSEIDSRTEPFKKLQLSREICVGLLDTEGRDVLKLGDDFPMQKQEVSSGYFEKPMFVHLADNLSCWLESGICPYLRLQQMHLLKETPVEERILRNESIMHFLDKIRSLWPSLSKNAQQERVYEILLMLGDRGVLDTLSIRQTAGSVDMLPPSKSQLLKTFTAQNNEKAKLTVGARALAKHCHRDSSCNWWGCSTGKEDDKNEYALSVVTRILEDASWINVHILPHDIKVVEVRSSEGYGARWTADGLEFRGFLEPQMEDGHAMGWQH
ncbi:uncharacterized protein LOC134184164 isoform X1 [Corticium candelabrum]|uniref:uncharacterized protein LOC134184164 isoform X1 n=1 Tax=Corticium candelabrum TaxID=121492 RepID=UPI002E371CE7|nr:uncharacterized protein LOC134184164 isoform X1 [Corticium candelabrum]